MSGFIKGVQGFGQQAGGLHWPVGLRPVEDRLRVLEPYSGEALKDIWKLTANGVMVEAAGSNGFAFVARQATLSNWPNVAGDKTAAIAGAGTDPTIDYGSPLGIGGGDDTAVFLPNPGKYFSASDYGHIDLATYDVIIEAGIIPPPASGAPRCCGDFDGGKGWVILSNPSGLPGMYIAGTGGFIYLYAPSVAPEVFSHQLYVMKSGGSGIQYCNALPGSAQSLTALGDTTHFNPLYLGYNVSQYGGALCWLALWRYAAGWLDTHLQQTLATERLAMWSGIYPALAKGSYTPTISRASYKYVSGPDKLYQVGNGAILVGSKGVNVEPASTNLVRYSQAFNAGYWVYVLMTVSTDYAVAPNGNQEADGMVADATLNSHRCYQSISMTAGQDYTWSLHPSPGDKGWVCLNWYNATDLHHYCYFNISTGEIGTVGANTQVRSELQPDGTYKFEVVFSPTVTGNTDVYLYPATGDGGVVFSGDASTVNINAWGGGVENRKGSTSYIHTPGASTVSRVADQIRIEGLQNIGVDGNALRGDLTVVAEVHTIMDVDAYAFSINDGGSSADRIELLIRAADGLAEFKIESTEAGSETNAIGTLDLRDDEQHTFRLVWGYGLVQLWVDGKLEATAVVTAIPDNLDRIDIGSSYAAVGDPIYVASLRIAA